MSQQHPFILYVGCAQKGREFLDVALARGAWAYLAEDAGEALGAYVAYSPDSVVIDLTACPEMAAEVYHHLRSVFARPLMILTTDPAWDVSITESDEVYILDPQIPPGELLDLISAALELPPAFVY